MIRPSCDENAKGLDDLGSSIDQRVSDRWPLNSTLPTQFERIIRDDAEHERIAKYIAEKPASWKGDRFNR